MKTKIITVLILSLFLIACTKRDTGAVTGAIVGGVVGNQIGKGSGRAWATGIGVLAGAYIGGSIGQSMDEQDRYRSQQALEEYPDNGSSSWQNPNNGNEYTVTPTNTYQASSGPCREYTTEAIIGGRQETIYGKACRQSDGSWQAIN